MDEYAQKIEQDLAEIEELMKIVALQKHFGELIGSTLPTARGLLEFKDDRGCLYGADVLVSSNLSILKGFIELKEERRARNEFLSKLFPNLEGI